VAPRHAATPRVVSSPKRWRPSRCSKKNPRKRGIIANYCAIPPYQPTLIDYKLIAQYIFPTTPYIAIQYWQYAISCKGQDHAKEHRFTRRYSASFLFASTLKKNCPRYPGTLADLTDSRITPTTSDQPVGATHTEHTQSERQNTPTDSPTLSRQPHTPPWGLISCRRCTQLRCCCCCPARASTRYTSEMDSR